MEEKINNQKIFSYVPSLLIKIILDTPLKDKDIFCNIANRSPSSDFKFKSNKNISNFKSQIINPFVFPIKTILPSSLIMNIKINGFQKLMSTLIIKDPKNQKEKLISEYLSIIIPRILLKISGIIAENGGEIVKYNDYELTAIWSNPNINNLKYNKFNAKLGLISAIEIMKKVDKTEISKGVNLDINIGMAIGDIYCVFFGGERKRTEFVILGEAMEKALLCLEKSLPHEVILSKELNDLFKKGGEISTMEIDETSMFYSILEFSDDKLRDFSNFKGLKLNNNIVYMNKNVYENLLNKVHILSSILPQGLIKYLDVGIEGNLQEINTVTILTILLHLVPHINNNINQIQNIIFDIQKATYLTFGTLLYISRISEGLLIRCVWGLDPGTFIDDTARAISTSSIIGHLAKYYNFKVGIGITTGSCFLGLISLHGSKKFFTIIGKKVNLSRVLAEEAYKNVINEKKIKYLVYCDKNTMKKSQKWYRYVFVSELRVNLNKKDDIFYSGKNEFFYGAKKERKVKVVSFNKNENTPSLKKTDPNIGRKYSFKQKIKSIFKRNSSVIIEKNEDINNNTNKSDDEKEIKNKKLEKENEYHLINEIYTPIEEEEYFMPNYYDPFPLIRTHINNSYNPKDKLYFYNLLTMANSDNIYESKNRGRYHTLTQSIQKVQSKLKVMIKLKKSQTIFGNSKKIQKFLKVINSAYIKCQRQFFLIKGPLGVGKSLFIRKCLNNFIGLNDYLSERYFTGEQFLFCNIMNPLTSTLPFNTVIFILRDIFLNIKRIDKIKELFNISEELKLDIEDLQNISFILSIGKNDIDLLNDFEYFKLSNITDNNNNKIMKEKENINMDNISYIEKLEGPFIFKNSEKLNIFFFEMIKLYKIYLNTKYEKENNSFLTFNNKNKNKNKKNLRKIPLILVLEDVHISNNYSIDFIQYLFNNNDKDLNPFIIILIEQTPFNQNLRPLTHGFFENFLIAFSEYSDKPNEDKIICFNIEPLMEKSDLEKLIIFSYKDSVLNNYKTNLESVDDKILDFLLMKSFHGIPLLVLSLFESLIKSEKFIQTLSGEYIITSELIDDNIICDWSDILLPYVYEKIVSMTINSLLSFKEILILKYASVIGTVFDIKTLDKLNPLKSIIKRKDLEKILIKLYNEYILEIFLEDIENQKNKRQNLICKMSFPLMREVLHQKFPMEKRAVLHMKTAKLLSTSKKSAFFSIENELKILKRHLLYSEMNIINEIESKKLRTVQDILQNKKVLNYNNLKLYLVKEICSKYYSNYIGNIMEGNMEILSSGNKWLKVSYFIDKRAKIFISLKNSKNIKNELYMIIPIKNIYKNRIASTKDSIEIKKNNLFIIYISKETGPLKPNAKKKIYFSSEQREEICKLDITINFLRVKVSYDKYVYNYGLSRFPLYKTKWYHQKILLYYADLEENGISIKNMNTMTTINSVYNFKKVNYSYLEPFNFKIFNKSKLMKKPFMFIIKSTLSIFFGKIQEKLSLNNSSYAKKEEDSKISFSKTYNYLYNFSIPNHLRRKINKFLNSSKKEMEQISREIYRLSKASTSFRDSIITKNRLSSLRESLRFYSNNKNNKNNVINFMNYYKKESNKAKSEEKKEKKEKIINKLKINNSKEKKQKSISSKKSLNNKKKENKEINIKIKSNKSGEKSKKKK